MEIQGVYAAIATKNMPAAEAFYTTLFEREPDDRPMDGLIRWRNVAGANIQLFLNKQNAGSSAAATGVTVVNNKDRVLSAVVRRPCAAHLERGTVRSICGETVSNPAS